MKEYLSLDSFLQEASGDTLTVRLMGRDYEVRKAIPAIMPLRMVQAEQLEETEKGTEMMRIIARTGEILFGEKSFREILETGITMDELALVIRRIFGRISGDDEAEGLGDEPGKALEKK